MLDDLYPIYSVENFHEAVEAFSQNLPFQVINMGLSDYDQAILDGFQIGTNGEENFLAYYDGHPDLHINTLISGIQSFLASSSSVNNQTSIDHVSNLILNAVNQVLLAQSNDQPYRIELNIRQTNDAHGIFWHTDSSLLECQCPNTPKGDAYNFLWTLKGPTTLYYLPSSELDKELTDKYYFDTNNELADCLNKINDGELDASNIFFPPKGYGTIHLNGKDTGCIHSGPAYDQQRLLILISREPIPNNPFFKISPYEAEKLANENLKRHELFERPSYLPERLFKKEAEQNLKTIRHCYK